MSDSKKVEVFVVMRAQPWSAVKVQPAWGSPDDVFDLEMPAENAGFLPVYWTRDAALDDNPGADVVSVWVDADWGVEASAELDN